jgi:hypothetical protein
MYKTLLLAACLALPFAGHAAEEKKMTPQQEKMTACNKEAADKKLAGDERKKFMSSCLSAKGVSQSQQDKMATCNKDAAAKNLKGDERKAFMSKCLSAGG